MLVRCQHPTSQWVCESCLKCGYCCKCENSRVTFIHRESKRAAESSAALHRVEQEEYGRALKGS
jgi:Fe-S-cluster containining protein